MPIKTVTPSTPSPSSGKAKVKRMPRTIAGVIPAPLDESRRQIISLYEEALNLLQSKKYDKAHAAFSKMLDTAPHDLGDRVRMYIAACVSHISKGSSDFKSHEERYDYAISLLNQGNYEDARDHFEQILLDHSSADYAFYGLALLASMTGDTQKCIQHLTEAIRLKSQNRYQARLDSDFSGVSDDPRFTDLLYPEA